MAGARRSCEARWSMNAVTRAALDEAVAAAVEVRGEEPLDVVLDVGCGRRRTIVLPSTLEGLAPDLPPNCRKGVTLSQVTAR